MNSDTLLFESTPPPCQSAPALPHVAGGHTTRCHCWPCTRQTPLSAVLGADGTTWPHARLPPARDRDCRDPPPRPPAPATAPPWLPRWPPRWHSPGPRAPPRCPWRTAPEDPEGGRTTTSLAARGWAGAQGRPAPFGPGGGPRTPSGCPPRPGGGAGDRSRCRVGERRRRTEGRLHARRGGVGVCPPFTLRAPPCQGRRRRRPCGLATRGAGGEEGG